MLECFFLLRTDVFESRESKTHFVNERCFGEDFAAWLHDRLLDRGSASSEPMQEDWGWAFLVSAADDTFFISIGIMDASVGASPADWRLDIAYDRGTNRPRHFFRKPDAKRFAELCTTIDAIIIADPRIHVLERRLPT